MRPLHRSLALGSVLALAACGTPADGMDAGPSEAGFDAADPPDAWVPAVPTDSVGAANEVPPGDPLYEGQQRFLFDSWGAERNESWPPADWMLELMTREPAVFGDQYASFGFTPNPSGEFPVGLSRGIEDPEQVYQTCAACHIGRLPDGRTWLGMPGQLDLSRFRYEVSMRWEAEGHPPLVAGVEASKALAYGPGRTAAETSDYPVAVPADYPPYWMLGDRTAMNYLGTGGNTRAESYLSIFTFDVGNPNDEEAHVPYPSSARIAPMIDFMNSIVSPPAPSQDPTLVAAGLAVFTRERCDSCHHIDDLAMNGIVAYDRAADGRERFPGDDPAFPRGSIRTDYLHRILIDGDPVEDVDAGAGADAGPRIDAGVGTDDGFAIYLAFISRNRLTVRPSDGYRVSDLHGLWATAPYLHNGSVPTLDALLRPAAERPSTFMRGDFMVDTTLAGSTNVGHEFGTTIDDTDRAALVAYLLSL